MSWQYTNLLCGCAVHRGEPKHVGVNVGILIVLIFVLFYNCVHHCGKIKSALILLMHGTDMKIIYLLFIYFIITYLFIYLLAYSFIYYLFIYLFASLFITHFLCFFTSEFPYIISLYYIKNQQEATLAVLFISNCKITLHVSDTLCPHHQEY
jgi:hypothetical protein